ncbi:5-formyltetrahydrofolate cyclo-ligase [Mycolicibacterium mucogenicum]|uniref:5-formyltetrahydrofolate cyclo-ligase n=1 Tax=Mycolicibacterium mucogenicum DSM 44124 TaxID=1226753 RepID=A0A8E4W3P1_MYCMU|nr:5-formyltetrahydrofolate cyclo-ligase [Mycolicibacterium mucogenicum]KAB7761448.1 5-formyltetrahydrofolate cyclo-ligase [Mycolicibacterium mucogenicum DSM 44124]QPG70276.1 5-formyltetrahydrofolate cyclo-ligase [Mycolicibacterium mucogenicum DSM 44124]
MSPEVGKRELRSTILRRRRALTPEQRLADAEALARWASELVSPGVVVCAYVPIGTEPGSPAMLDALVDAGARVLLPVTRPDAPLSWGWYRSGHLTEASYGLLEPATPHLPPDAIRQAGVILVPALGVDRAGVRLGRGAGFYDRSLSLAAPAARLVAVVYDDDLLPALPAEPHDIAMTHALTPRAGLVTLGI